MIVRDLINKSSEEFIEIIDKYNEVYVTKSVEVMLANIDELKEFIREIKSLKSLNKDEQKLLELAESMDFDNEKDEPLDEEEIEESNDKSTEEAIRRNEYDYDGEPVESDVFESLDEEGEENED